MPDAHADGLFAAETTMPLVRYLNWVFLCGGFPFLTGSSDALQITEALAEDLLPR